MKHQALSQISTTPINQAEIIPFGNVTPPYKTWEDKLTRAFTENKDLGFFYIPVHVRISHLPADTLYRKIIDDMRFLKKTDPERFDWCVDSFDEQYNKFFGSDKAALAEIIPIDDIGGVK